MKNKGKKHAEEGCGRGIINDRSGKRFVVVFGLFSEGSR